MAKNYRYIGTSTNPKDAIFNQQYYDSLIDNRQYQDAYDYAMQYPMLDPMEQAEYKQHLKNMLREGKVVEAIYKNIDEAAYPAVDFRNLVMQPGGLGKLETGNTYANQFKTWKNELGGGENRLQVRFDPQKRKGIFGIDFLARDNNDANIDVFYEKSGLNKQYLEANGVSVRVKDGYTYLEFDKSNDLANKILLNIPHSVNFTPWINGVKEDGTIVSDHLRKAGGGDSGLGSYTTTAGGYQVVQMQNLYKDAQKIEDTAYNNGTAKVKQYSSQIFPLLYDNSQELENQLNQGSIKSSDFNSRIKRENQKLIDGIAFINPNEYEIQSNWFNDDKSDVNVPLTPEQKEEIHKRYKATKQKDIRYGLVISGNKVGLAIQLPAITNNKGEVKEESCDFMIFGDDIAQQLQRQINTDPGMQAYQEINDMQDLGYTYKDGNGNTYTYDGLGGWIVNGTDKSKTTEYVRRQIHKDKAAEDVGNSIILNNISINGTLVNPQRYLTQTKIAAFMIANDARRQGDIIEALKEVYGNSIDYTSEQAIVDAIFGLKGTGDVVAQEYEDKISDPNVYEKLNDIFEIYTNMLNVGNSYIRTINK